MRVWRCEGGGVTSKPRLFLSPVFYVCSARYGKGGSRGDYELYDPVTFGGGEEPTKRRLSSSRRREQLKKCEEQYSFKRLCHISWFCFSGSCDDDSRSCETTLLSREASVGKVRKAIVINVQILAETPGL